MMKNCVLLRLISGKKAQVMSGSFKLSFDAKCSYEREKSVREIFRLCNAAFGRSFNWHITEKSNSDLQDLLTVSFAVH